MRINSPQIRFGILVLLLAAGMPRSAEASRSYFDGVSQPLSTVCPVTGNVVIALQTYVGYFTDPNEPYPKTGDIAYVHAVGANVSPCVNDAVGFDFFLPDGASLAISAVNPVYCFRGKLDGTFSEHVPTDSIGACSQSPSTGAHGGLFFGWSALAPGTWLEIQVPVVFNKQLLGLAGPASHRLSAATSSAFGTAVPYQPVTVFYRADFGNLVSSSVTATGANLGFDLKSYFHAGLLSIDYGTTTAFGSSGPPVSVPNSALSFPIASALTGLNASTHYFWRARFVTSDGTFTSATQDFTTGGASGQSLTVSKNGTGTVTSSPGGIACGTTCSAIFATGSSVTLTAMPQTGWLFSGWSGGCTGTSSCLITMSSAKSVTAQFTRAIGSLSITLGGLPAGSSLVVSIVGPDGFNTTHTMTTGTGFNLSDLPTGTYTVNAPVTTVGGKAYSPNSVSQSAVVNFGVTTTVAVTYSLQSSAGRAGLDFDGDGKADLALYRPSTGYWYVERSSSSYGTYLANQWGLSTDVVVPGDYDGDGKADLALYRPSTGYWYIRLSSTNYATSLTYQWGVSTDVPVPGDYDGDGKTDLGLYRPSTGYWYILQSSTGYTTYLAQQWGLSTDTPVPGDYDGDGKTDLGLYRRATGVWYVLKSSTNYTTYLAQQWGLSTDIAVAGDYDGDGRADLALYRPSTGYWYILQSSTNYGNYLGYQWGLSTDVVVPGDYDGDGKIDLGLYRPSTGYWYILLSSTHFTTSVTQQWGLSTDTPVSKRH